jgi:hypothetical protein
MKRVVRILSLPCIALCAIVLILWGRSFWVLDRLSYQVGDGRDYKIRSDAGRISYFHTTAVDKHNPQPTTLFSQSQRYTLPVVQLVAHSLLFEYENSHYGDEHRGGFLRKLVVVPYWFLALATALVPAGRYYTYRRELMLSAEKSSTLSPQVTLPGA